MSGLRSQPERTLGYSQKSLLWAMSSGLIPYPVSVTSILTTIHSNCCRGLPCCLLCSVRRSVDNGGAVPVPFSSMLLSSSWPVLLPLLDSSLTFTRSFTPCTPISQLSVCTAGTTKVVLIVSLPPDGVNLQALLSSQSDCRNG